MANGRVPEWQANLLEVAFIVVQHHVGQGIHLHGSSSLSYRLTI
jgi:hypothetical protein